MVFVGNISRTAPYMLKHSDRRDRERGVAGPDEVARPRPGGRQVAGDDCFHDLGRAEPCHSEVSCIDGTMSSRLRSRD